MLLFSLRDTMTLIDVRLAVLLEGCASATLDVPLQAARTVCEECLRRSAALGAETRGLQSGRRA